jgi:hypothetical protein
MNASVRRRLRAAACCCGWLATLMATLAGTSAAAWAQPVPASAASAAHRPLRDNQPPTVLEPTEPQQYSGDAGAPAFTVVPRKGQMVLFPCSQCHKVMPLNATPRKLVAAPHPAALQHGQGRLWCLDCHVGSDRDWLHTLRNPKIDFNDSHLVCAQCHSARHRDWSFGGHGKRVAGWTGERQLYACTHCHDPHNPVIQPRAPSKPPAIRAGLAPMAGEHEPALPLWKRTREGTADATPPRP